MQNIEENYDIRLAKYEDISRIMNFIKDYWKPGHIMSRDREYFEFEFCNGKNVNFVIAEERNSKEIGGILGFVYTSHTPGKQDVWRSIWRVRTDNPNANGLGIELQRKIPELTGCRYHNGLGLNPKTAVPLVRLFLGNTVQRMRQFYVLNTTLDSYQIAVINHSVNVEYKLQKGVLKRIQKFEDIPKEIFSDYGQIPYKDAWYCEKKFFNNIRRKYLAYGIENVSGQVEALIIARECKVNERKVLRIVDYFGKRELLTEIGENLKELMCENEYEYIDFYTWGFEEEYLLKAGFAEREKNDDNIIPNYFEPFEQRNVDIWVHYEKDGTLFYKADGDQDRANS